MAKLEIKVTYNKTLWYWVFMALIFFKISPKFILGKTLMKIKVVNMSFFVKVSHLSFND